MADVPSIDELRARAAERGVHPTDADLERVQGFLGVLLPQLEELAALVPASETPAAVYRPEVER